MISMEPVVGRFAGFPDRNPTESKTLFVALLVGLAHVMSGLAVIAAPAALNATQISSLALIAEFLGYTRGGFAAAVLIFAGAMAIVGSTIHATLPRKAHVAMFAPQEVLLLLQLWAISLALWTGHYPDGYVPIGGAWFILADQAWAWILAVSHSIWLAAFIYRGGSDSGNFQPGTD